jgi:hypothetical protein
MDNPKKLATRWPYWLEIGITEHNFGRGPSKDHSTKVWLQLALWFLRRRLKGEMLTDGRQTKSDHNSSRGLKPGEITFPLPEFITFKNHGIIHFFK